MGEQPGEGGVPVLVPVLVPDLVPVPVPVPVSCTMGVTARPRPRLLPKGGHCCLTQKVSVGTGQAHGQLGRAPAPARIQGGLSAPLHGEPSAPPQQCQAPKSSLGKDFGVPPCPHTPWQNGANCRDRGHRSPEGRCPGANPAGGKSPPGSPEALRHPALVEKGHESLTHPLWVLSRLWGEAVSGVPVPQHPSCPAPPCQQPPLLPLNLCQGLGAPWGAPDG